MSKNPTIGRAQNVIVKQRKSARSLHYIVIGLLSILGLMAATYPLAIWRVSQMEKFQGSPVKSGLVIQSPQPDPK
jgi:hypothetical protein